MPYSSRTHHDNGSKCESQQNYFSSLYKQIWSTLERITPLGAGANGHSAYKGCENKYAKNISLISTQIPSKEGITTVTGNNIWLQIGRNLVVEMKWPVRPLAEVSVKCCVSSERWLRGCSRLAGSASLTDSGLLTPALA